jgi:hypothetical protein
MCNAKNLSVGYVWFCLGCFVYQREGPRGFQKTYQQLAFPADLGENIGRYVRSALANRIGEINGLQQDLPTLEQDRFRSEMLIVYF